LLTDITEMKCRDGKLYLCPVLDCFDAAIVGFSMDDNMKATLAAAALKSVVVRWGNMADCILHSDRGSQFTSQLYRGALEAHGFRQSMGRTGTCADNARMESFFATLKKELIYQRPMYRLTRKEVRAYVFGWIAYYNRKRRHTANEGNLPPLAKRGFYFQNERAA
jgi:transposase InsO family protein